MANGISLLPDDLKEKAEREKEKMKQAISRPEFKFHEPEAKAPGISTETIKPAQNRSGMEIGLNKFSEQPTNRGVFQIKEKGSASLSPAWPRVTRGPRIENREPIKKFEPIKPPLPKAIAPENSVKRIEQPQLSETRLKMHVPETLGANGLDLLGKKVISETSDKIHEIIKPQSFFDLLKRKVQSIALKKSAAEINLISEDYQKVVVEQFWRRLNFILIALLVLTLVFSVAYIGIKIYKMNLIGDYETTAYELQKAESEIASYEADEAQLSKLQNRAQILQVILKNHLYWTKLFDALEHSTAENVLYSSFVAEDSGRVLLAATAKSYADAAKQIFIFENADFVKAVEVSSASRSVNEATEQTGGKEVKSEKVEVQFNVSLTLKDGALLK
ncbi:MAG: hypothetical protein AAB766_03945 [Patescibacteria group bacterium]